MPEAAAKALANLRDPSHFENAQRVHSQQLAAGLASEFQNVKISLHFEDSLQLAAGFFNGI